ncbi:MAG: glycosyltransferase family 2 protein [Lachnospiraceae bacterium]|jgi:glycosyltransferase involved in cell wall biosynthesis|nr:glycosyltransferase family 2 protein [Lachnospiraceae bacterium]
MKKVLVLMSTYNGEKYFSAQIESILTQKNVDVKLLIRDDGSTDETINIINIISAKYTNKISVIIGQNLGYEKSFLELLLNAKDADFFAFADQDDVWDSDKLLIAIEKLNKFQQAPALYYSNVRVTNAQLQYSHELEDKGYDKKACKLLNSGAMGCTIVLNKSLLEILQKYHPQEKWPHDYWIMTVALYVGAVYYDPSSHMSYRQHAKNATGGDIKLKHRLNKLIQGLKGYYKNRWSSLAFELLNGFSEDISPGDKLILECFRDYQKNISYKINLLVRNNITKNNLIKDFFLKLSILLNKA